MKPAALFSLNDTSNVDLFAEQLISSGWDIIASRETVAILEKKGLPVKDIADFTGLREDFGFPPTLHAKVEKALTADSPPRIELVYVIPYPLAVGNDVGGRTLLALAVKGGRTAVMSVADMKRVASAISETGKVPPDMRLELADKATFEIAAHYSSLLKSRDKCDFLAGRFSYALLNGENPYQIPASVFASVNDDDPLSLVNFKKVSGEAPCFTNMADADCILNTICLAAEAFMLNTGSIPHLCVAAKHGNACGMGISIHSPLQAVERALFGNPRSIWGGEVITNFPIDGGIAGALFKSDRRESIFGDGSWMLDLVMAPSFSPDAISVLGRRKERKLFENGALGSPFINKSEFSYRNVRGGLLRQPPATYILDLNACEIETGTFSNSEIESMIIAWAVAFTSNHGGNEVALAKDGALLGAGGGPSTVEGARVAVERTLECGHNPKGAAFAADAFFPFTDATAVLCEAGASVGCVPGGGMHESDVRAYFSAKNARVAYLPQEFRGFCRH